MVDYLPRDIWIQIFLRLPAKTILRCLSVCKSWKLTIQHRSFIDAHFLRQRQDLMLVRYIPEKDIKSDNHFARKKKHEVYSIHIDDEAFSLHAHHEFPILHRSGEHYRVVGCSNGIICITDDQFGICHTTYLWNPTIQKCVTLPRPMFTYDKIGGFVHELGFGFDEKTNDYKVIRIVHPNDDYDTPLEIEIYSLSTGIWREASHLALNLSAQIFNRDCAEKDRQVYVNGAVHWVGWNRGQDSFMVIAFLLGEEVFHCFELPTNMIHDYYWMKELRPVVFQETLSLIQYSEERCGVWLMKDYGDSSTWSKFLDINLSGQVERVIGIRNKGELLIEILGGLYSYDHEATKGKQFNFLDKRDLLDWKRLQKGHLQEPYYLPPGYIPHYELDEAASNMENGMVFVQQNVPNYEAGDDMEAHFHFPEHIRNYDPEAAPKELGIRCRRYRFDFHCERYSESLALIGSIN